MGNQHGVTFSEFKALSLICGLLSLTSSGLQAAQPLELLTGGGDPLVSATQSVFATNLPANAQLQFDFGFSTDEVFAPGGFFDSFTVSFPTLTKTAS